MAALQAPADDKAHGLPAAKPAVAAGGLASLCLASLCLAGLLAGCTATTPESPPGPRAGHGSAGATPPAGPVACDPAADPMQGWDTPAAPRKVFGNTWYVGTCGITALLVTSPAGHVLVDAGTEAAAPHVAASIRAAGFDPAQVRYIVGSHEHNDHAAGIAALQRLSGATVLARAPAAEALRRGNVDRRDPQFDIHAAFPAVDAVQAIADGHVLELGPLRLTAHATPGHAAGGSSWTWRSCEQGRCVDIAYVDSVSAISDDSFRYGDEAAHPGYLASFRAGLERIAGLPCDVLLTPHPAASQLWRRIGPQANLPLADPAACKAYAGNGRQGLEQRLARERAVAP